MSGVLLKAFSFILVIIIGYFLKKKGFFKKEDVSVITKITLNITLPAAVVTSFSNFEKDSSLFMIIAIGFATDFVLVMLGYLISMKKERDIRIHYMFNITGYNIGSFTMPFVQGFLGGGGVVTACLFDMGNAMMCSGGAYITVISLLGGGEGKLRIRDIFKKLLKSAPFDIYLIMMIFAFLNIRIPDGVVTAVSAVAGANGFMAMLMLGLMLELDIDLGSIKVIAKALAVRYAFSAVLAYLLYSFAPFTLEVRQVLALTVFSPCSALVPAFTGMSGGNTDMAGFANSLSIIISVVIMTCLIAALHI